MKSAQPQADTQTGDTPAAAKDVMPPASDRAVNALKNGDWNEADRLCTEWLHEDPGNIAPRFLKAVAALFVKPPLSPGELKDKTSVLDELSDTVRAKLTWFGKLAEENEALRDNPHIAAVAAYEAHLRPGAGTVLQETLERFPDSAELNLLRGRKDFQHYEYLYRAIELDPSMASAYYTLIGFKLMRRQSAEALRLILELLKQYPDMAAFHLAAAEICHSKKLHRQAAYHLFKTIALAPGTQTAAAAEAMLKKNAVYYNAYDSAVMLREDYELPEINWSALPAEDPAPAPAKHRPFSTDFIISMVAGFIAAMIVPGDSEQVHLIIGLSVMALCLFLLRKARKKPR